MAATVVLAADSRRLMSIAALEDELGEATVQASLAHYERLLDRASAAIERYCGRIFAQQRYQEAVPADRDTRVFLTHTPIVTVEDITHGSSTITDARIELPLAGVVYREAGWPIDATDAVWMVTYVAGYRLPEQTNAMEPSSEALPADIEAAVLESVRVWSYEGDPSSRVTSRDFGDQRISYHIQAGRQGLPVMAEQLLVTWRRWVVR